MSLTVENLIVDKLFQIIANYNEKMDSLDNKLLKKIAEVEAKYEEKLARVETSLARVENNLAKVETSLATTENKLLQEMQTGYTLIGYAETNEPIFIRRKCTYPELCIILTQELQRGRLLVDSLCQLPYIDKLDFQDIFYSCGPCAYFEGDNVWTSVVDDKNQLIVENRLDQVVAVFAKYGVQLLYDGKPI